MLKWQNGENTDLKIVTKTLHPPSVQAEANSSLTGLNSVAPELKHYAVYQLRIFIMVCVCVCVCGGGGGWEEGGGVESARGVSRKDPKIL